MRTVLTRLSWLGLCLGVAVVVNAQLTNQPPIPAPAPAQLQPAAPPEVAPATLAPPVTPAPLPTDLAPATVEAPKLQPLPDVAKPAPKPKPKAPVVPTYRGTLTAIDTIVLTITVESKDKARTFCITSQTRFFKDNKPATFSDATEGDEVSVIAKKGKSGKQEATVVHYGLKAPSAKSKKSKEK